MPDSRPTDQSLACGYEGCLATSTRVLDRAITALYDEALKPHGVRSTQLSVLVTVAALGSPTASDLVPALRIDQSTLSRSIDRLVARGLLRGTGDPADARLRRLTLTAPGRRTLREALPAWRRSQQRVKQLLGPALSDRLVAGAAQLSTESD